MKYKEFITSRTEVYFYYGFNFMNKDIKRYDYCASQISQYVPIFGIGHKAKYFNIGTLTVETLSNQFLVPKPFHNASKTNYLIYKHVRSLYEPI